MLFLLLFLFLLSSRLSIGMPFVQAVFEYFWYVVADIAMCCFEIPFVIHLLLIIIIIIRLFLIVAHALQMLTAFPNLSTVHR